LPEGEIIRGPAGEEAAYLRPREQEILGLLAAGMSRRAIAEQLVLSDYTVRSHIRSAMKRLNCHTALEAVAAAMRGGWIEPP
jgi:DNA-binding NarL/FixJ family response regulator